MQAWGELLAGDLAPRPKGKARAPAGNIVAFPGRANAARRSRGR